MIHIGSLYGAYVKHVSFTKNLLLKISIQVNQILLKAFESTKGYSNKIIRGLYLFFKNNSKHWKGRPILLLF